MNYTYPAIRFYVKNPDWRMDCDFLLNKGQPEKLPLLLILIYVRMPGGFFTLFGQITIALQKSQTSSLLNSLQSYP